MPVLDVSAFQSAFGRLCDVSARALSEGADRQAVLEAFQGRGTGADLAHLRAHRRHVAHRIELVKHYAERHNIGARTVALELIRAGRAVREAAEVEWMVAIPIVSPNP